MLEDCKQAFKNIAAAAAGGKHYNEFLRMVEQGHAMLQPGKGEAGENAPIRPIFQGPGAATTPPPASTEGQTEAEAGGLVKDGQVYEATE